MVPAIPTIPPELLPILAGLGIDDPANCRWQRREPLPARRMRAHYFCPCGSRPDGQERVELNHAHPAGRRVFIGQCRWCKTVYRRDAKAG